MGYNLMYLNCADSGNLCNFKSTTICNHSKVVHFKSKRILNKLGNSLRINLVQVKTYFNKMIVTILKNIV